MLADSNCKMLLRYYSLLNQAYTGRLKHRTFSFIEECYDDGHTYQLVRLRVLLAEVEVALNKIWSTTANNTKCSHVSLDDEDSDDIRKEPIDSIHQKIESSRLKRITSDRQIEEAFKTYKFTINLQDEKYLLEDKLFKVIDKKTNAWKTFKSYEDTCLGNLVIIITNIVLAVDKLGGFDSNYIPDNRVLDKSQHITIRPYNVAVKEYNRYCELYTLDQIKCTYLHVLTKWPTIFVMLSNLRAIVAAMNTYEVLTEPYKIAWYENRLMLFYNGRIGRIPKK